MTATRPATVFTSIWKRCRTSLSACVVAQHDGPSPDTICAAVLVAAMIVAAPCKSSPPAGLLPSIGLLRRLVCSPSPALSAYLSRNVDSNAAVFFSLSKTSQILRTCCSLRCRRFFRPASSRTLLTSSRTKSLPSRRHSWSSSDANSRPIRRPSSGTTSWQNRSQNPFGETLVCCTTRSRIIPRYESEAMDSRNHETSFDLQGSRLVGTLDLSLRCSCSTRASSIA
mmetsp:Transcript_518/g.1830  ORF Transcript_518/g.1830 Transcript_518/m.1830 type:complete len:226 (+) Transcript_518:10056-10733(+)